MKTDRRELTDQEKAECSSLKAEIAAFNERNTAAKKLTQELLAQELGMTQGNFSSHLNGRRALSKEMAAKVAMMLGVPVQKFSPRLADEIIELSKAVEFPESLTALNEHQALYQASRANSLMEFATPRTRAVLERINQAAHEGRMSEADLNLLDQIAARFEHGASAQVSGQGSHERLRGKLQNHDPHPDQ